MTTGSPLGTYLRARRSAVRPEDVGLPALDGRRVVGLRRDEVAGLAGISSQYYLRLEQGRDHEPSDQVLRSIARALRLDSSAVDYMARLVRTRRSTSSTRPRRVISESERSGLDALLAQWATTPAFITDGSQDVVVCNDLARTFLPGELDVGRNVALLVFGDAWRAVDETWEATARRTVAALRFHADPHDAGTQEVIGLLCTRDLDFRRLWGEQEAAPMMSGLVVLSIAGYGRVEFTQQSLAVAGGGHHVLTVLHTEKGSASEDAVRSYATASASVA